MIVKKAIIPLFILIAASINQSLAMKRNVLHTINQIEASDTDTTVVLNCEHFKVHSASKCGKYGHLCLLHEKPCYKGHFTETGRCKELQLLEHKDDLVIGSYHDSNGAVLAIEDLTDMPRDKRIHHLKSRLDLNVQKVATLVIVEHDRIHFYDKKQRKLLVGRHTEPKIQSRDDLKEFENYLLIDNDVKIEHIECTEDGCTCIDI